MNNYNSTAIFASVLTVIIMFLATLVGIQYNRESIQNEQLRQRVDSLTAECHKKDLSLDEATSIAMSLSDRMGKLYEIDSVTHRKLFSEAD